MVFNAELNTPNSAEALSAPFSITPVAAETVMALSASSLAIRNSSLRNITVMLLRSSATVLDSCLAASSKAVDALLIDKKPIANRGNNTMAVPPTISLKLSDFFFMIFFLLKKTKLFDLGSLAKHCDFICL